MTNQLGLDPERINELPMRPWGFRDSRLRLYRVWRTAIVMWSPICDAPERVLEGLDPKSESPVYSLMPSHEGGELILPSLPRPGGADHKLLPLKLPGVLESAPPRNRWPNPGEVESCLLARKFMYSMHSLNQLGIIPREVMLPRDLPPEARELVHKEQPGFSIAYRWGDKSLLGTLPLEYADVTWEQNEGFDTPIATIHLKGKTYLRVFPIICHSCNGRACGTTPSGKPLPLPPHGARHFNRPPATGTTTSVAIRWKMQADGRPVGLAFQIDDE